MMMPKRTKFRKMMRGRNCGLSYRGAEVSFGELGIKAMEACFLTAKQIEAARKTISGATKRGGRIWIRVFPDKPMTKKPLETRMGKGKGGVEYYAAVVKPGKILFEISGVPAELAMSALKQASAKLPIKTKIVSNEI
jgi:large subunit ribosomal protein L16